VNYLNLKELDALSKDKILHGELFFARKPIVDLSCISLRF